jgi:restriction system protein
MGDQETGTEIVPTFRAMLWPTLLALRSLGNSAAVRELTDRASEIAGYSDAQLAVLHNDGPGTEVQYRMAWARSYLKEVGAANNSRRGVWSITEYGQSLTEGDMAEIRLAHGC